MARLSSARAPWALLAAVGACLFYALVTEGAYDSPHLTADGAGGIPVQSWLELAVAVVATGAVVAWVYGVLSLRPARTGVAGLALLAGFAAWAGVSIAWSVAGDNSWAEANRVLMYALTVLLGLLLGSSLPRAPERAGLAIAAVTVPVALYAIGGKTLPGLSIGGFSLDHTATFNRLSAPLGYWNALALASVTALLPCLRAAASPAYHSRARVAALLGAYLFVLTLGMTYSRGGILALAVGVAVLVGLAGAERVRTLVLLGATLAAAVVPLGLALGRSDLTSDFIPVTAREDDALLVLIAVLVCGAALALFGAWLVRSEAAGRFPAARGRALGRPFARAGAALAALAILGALVSGAAGRAFSDFKDVEQAADLSDPNRLLSGNSGNRWVWWEEAAGAWSDRPIAGWGAGSFSVTHLLYRKQQLQIQQPHNVGLQWLAEDGLVGFALAAGALGALLAAGLARVRSAAADRGAAAALLAVAAAWVVQSLVEWSWDIPGVTLPMLVALGVLAARPRPEPPRPLGARGTATAAAAAALVLVVLSAMLPAIARTQTNGALVDAGRPGVTDAELADAAAQAELAARLNPLAVQPLIDAATIAAGRRRLDEARAYLLRAIRRQPYDWRAWSRLSAVEFERGDRVAQVRAAERAVRLDPRGPVARAQLARVIGQASISGSASATGAPLPTTVTP